jgi:predicted O-methyltransferase YrrM
MSVPDSLPDRAPQAGLRAPGVFAAGAEILFATVIFLSALLLFSVQPMFTKLLLPALGGSPGVWSTAMAFFQTLLLLGYLYAHLSSRWLPLPAALVVHGAVLLSAFWMLPLAVSAAAGAPPETNQGLWLILVFALSVGLPFFALAASAPLLQAWFARAGYAGSANPYKLYVASNIGSFTALLTYPLAIEPLAALGLQTMGWKYLFALLAAGFLACGLVALQGPGRGSAGGVATQVHISWRQRALWTGLAAVPSGLLVAVTAHLSTDVASAPLLWVLPLALFLLTFIIAFRDREIIGDGFLTAGLARLAPFVILSLIGYVLPLTIQFGIHLGFFFLAATMCHRQLYLRRPDATGLTEFYLWMAFGGMVGGLFAGLAAPFLFDTILEYRILLIAALLAAVARADAPAPLRQAGLASAILIGALGLTTLAGPLLGWLDGSLRYAVTFAAVLGMLAVVVFNRHGPITSAAAATAAFLIGSTIAGAKPEAVVRSFFGVNYVQADETGRLRLLRNGSTIHGAHRVLDEDGRPMTGRPQPTTYYHDGGAINQALLAARRHAGGTLPEVAVIGLGAGAMACQSTPGETWTYFEIDRKVAELARNRALFPFLSDCTPGAEIVIGDGRLTIQTHRKTFDVIILDAFSSDAVPAHLLTREAFAAYTSRLKPGGVIIAHLSNRYMDLRGVATAAAMDRGMRAAAASIPVDAGDQRQKLQHAAPTTAVAMSADPPYLEALQKDPRWIPGDRLAHRSLWTDDYANIMGAMLRNFANHWSP